MSRHRRQQRKRASARRYCTYITPFVSEIVRGRLQASRSALLSLTVERVCAREGVVYARATAVREGLIRDIVTNVQLTWADMARREMEAGQ